MKSEENEEMKMILKVIRGIYKEISFPCELSLLVLKEYSELTNIPLAELFRLESLRTDEREIIDIVKRHKRNQDAAH